MRKTPDRRIGRARPWRLGPRGTSVWIVTAVAVLPAGCAQTRVSSTQPLPASWTVAQAPRGVRSDASGAATTRSSRARHWPQRTVAYRAANNWHLPLWFEDAPMERYGCSVGDPFQPGVSVALAALHTAAVPYSAMRHPPWQKVYPSDWPEQPPDGCIMIPPFDGITPLAIGAEVAVIVNLILLVP